MNDQIFQQRIKDIGKIRCFSVCQKKVGMAGNMGNIFILDQTNVNSILFSTQGIYGTISAIDMSDVYIVVGFETGKITFFNIQKGEDLKSASDIHQKRLLLIKFFYTDKQKSLLISSDEQGYTVLIKFSKGLFSYKTEPKLLISQAKYPIQNMAVLSDETKVRHTGAHYQNEKLIGLINQEKVWIIAVDVINDKPHLLYAFGISEQQNVDYFGSICWGEALVWQDARSRFAHTFVQVVSWNNRLCFVQPNIYWETVALPNGQSEPCVQKVVFENTPFVVFPDKIILVHMISPGILMTIDINQSVKLINTRSFLFQPQVLITLQPQDYIEFSIKPCIMTQTFKLINIKQSKSSMLQQSGYDKGLLSSAAQTQKSATKMEEELKILDPETKELIEQQQSKNMILFTNSFYYAEEEDCFYFLCDTCIGQIRLEKWHQQVNKMLDNQDFSIAMHYIISVYQGYNKFSGTQVQARSTKAKQIDEFIQIIIAKYTQKIKQYIQGDCSDKPGLDKALLNIIVEFLLYTNQTKYLYEYVRNLLRAILGKDDQFFQLLESFIKQSMITVIPNDVLSQIVSYYTSKENVNYDLVDQLITQINFDQIDVSPYTQLCLEKKLIKGLIHICTSSEQEIFAAPLSKLWGLFLSYKSDQKTPFSEYSVYGTWTLWYVRLCLRQQKINGEQIKPDNYQLLLRQLIEWVFDELNYSDIMQFNPQAGFEVIDCFFSTDNLSVMGGWEETEPDLKLPINRDEIEASIFDYNPKSKVHQVLLAAIQNYKRIAGVLEKKDKKLWQAAQNEFNLFLSKLAYANRVQIKLKKKFEVLVHLLENPDALSSLKVEASEVAGLQKFTQSDIQEFTQGDFLIKYMKQLGDALTDEEKIKLQLVADKSPFTEVSCMIAASRSNYQRCINLYTQSKNEIVRLRVFGWLSNQIVTLESQSSKEVDTLKNLIVKFLKDLMKADHQKTRILIVRFLKNRETEIVKDLESQPVLQLQYIDDILKDREEGKQVDDKLLIRHIELMCRLCKQRVLSEIQKWVYPVDHTLRTCKQENVLDATAYLLERTGAIESALNVHVQILEQVITDNISVLSQSKSQKSDQSLVQSVVKQIDQQFDTIEELCKKQKFSDNAE